MARRTSTAAPSRVFKSQTVIMHDLYKLEVANAIKNNAWQPGHFDPEKVEHCHFFHTVDKNGAPQKNCAPTNGHFHEMILVSEGTPDAAPVYKCGPAMRWIIVDQGGKKVKRAAPCLYNDVHTHDVTYKKSEEFKPAKLNSEAVKFISEATKEPESVPGIVG